jgi:MFS family permease
MSEEAQAWKPKYNPWLVAMTVTLATFMEVLDSSIANVALPHIAGSLGASQDESTWVLTSYLVSNAIILPASAWLATVMGRKRFYMLCVATFTVSSMLCGFALSLPMLIFFRILQGAGGGGMGPSEQAILADTFPPAKRGMGFAVYGMAVVVAPAIGPTLGGWITDNFDWRWIFFINIPIGLLSLFLTNRVVEDPPYMAGKGVGLRMDGPRQGSAGGLVRFHLHHRFLRRLHDYAGGAGLLGVASSGTGAGVATDEESQLRLLHWLQLHPGRGALRHHGAGSAVFADHDGLFGAASRHGSVAGRPGHDDRHARRRSSAQKNGPALDDLARLPCYRRRTL